MNVKIELPEKMMDQIEGEIANQQGLTIIEHSTKEMLGKSGMEPFSILVLSVGAYAVISRIIDLIADKRNPGAIVQADSTEQLTISQSPGIPNGHVLVIDPKGEQTMLKRKDVGEELFKNVIDKTLDKLGFS